MLLVGQGRLLGLGGLGDRFGGPYGRTRRRLAVEFLQGFQLTLLQELGNCLEMFFQDTVLELIELV